MGDARVHADVGLFVCRSVCQRFGSACSRARFQCQENAFAAGIMQGWLRCKCGNGIG